MFHLIDVDNWVRKEHYQAFGGVGPVSMSYGITVRVDVTNLVRIHKEKNVKFYPMLLYCLTKAVNQTKEFRMAKDEQGRLGYYDMMNVNYTVFHKEDESYSDIWSYYDEDFSVFYQTVLQDMEDAKDKRGLLVKEGRPDNFYCVSSLPWVDFTNYTPIINGVPHGFMPAIETGKYVEENGRMKMAVAVLISHGVADGYHTCMFYDRLQRIMDDFTVDER